MDISSLCQDIESWEGFQHKCICSFSPNGCQMCICLLVFPPHPQHTSFACYAGLSLLLYLSVLVHLTWLAHSCSLVSASLSVSRTEGLHHLGGQCRNWGMPHGMWGSWVLTVQWSTWYLCHIHTHLHIWRGEHSDDAANSQVRRQQAECKTLQMLEIFNRLINICGGRNDYFFSLVSFYQI